MTYAEIQDIMLSSGSLICILHYCLGVRKRCAQWVPQDPERSAKAGKGVLVRPHAKKI